MLRLFVSYSHEDKQFVEKLVADLISDGIEIWLDTKDIIPGTRALLK